jgi:hypothetical protein
MEHHDVGVLLDRARFAQVGELGPLVLALLDGAASCDRASTGRSSSLASVLRPRVISETSCTRFLLAALAGRREQLQVVDDQQAQPSGALEPAGAGAQARDAERRCSSMKKLRCRAPG